VIPDWLREKLANPPAAGAGIHAWLFSVARQLHAHMPVEAVGACLEAATVNAARRVTAREIRDAVNNSLAVAWERGGQTVSRAGQAVSRSPRKLAAGEDREEARWPGADPVARQMAAREVAREVGCLYDLWERSPIQWDDATADDWIDTLLPSGDFLCLAGDHPATARSRRRKDWYFGRADRCGLIVPAGMTGPSGMGLDGRRSHRCLDNTGARRWVIIEFDTGSIDEQAALHWYLRACTAVCGWPGLRLAVHSGGKSLHGWYGPVQDEGAARELMGYAVSLGADPATWTRCQLVRLPGGQRARKGAIEAVSLPDGWEDGRGETVRQEVFFYDGV
jgi:hypothetical protein